MFQQVCQTLLTFKHIPLYPCLHLVAVLLVLSDLFAPLVVPHRKALTSALSFSLAVSVFLLVLSSSIIRTRLGSQLLESAGEQRRCFSSSWNSAPHFTSFTSSLSFSSFRGPPIASSLSRDSTLRIQTFCCNILECQFEKRMCSHLLTTSAWNSEMCW